MAKSRKKASTVRKPRILIVTPEITYLPEGMGNLAGKMSAKAGGMADVSASLVAALFDLGADVHVALPHYRRMFHMETIKRVSICSQSGSEITVQSAIMNGPVKHIKMLKETTP